MRVLVVSGFLGAGKTTFIQQMSRACGRDFVVYENEYGQQDVDAALLSKTDELSVWESTEQCICCSGKQDFASSVLTIANTIDPEYLVVEPTGIARLSNVMANIAQVSYERIVPLAPVTIVDAVSWAQQRRRYPNIFDDQVANAPTIVLSKMGSTFGTGTDELLARIRGLNPQASIVDVPWDQLAPAWYEKILGQAANGSVSPLVSTGEQDAPESLSIAGVSLPTESHLLWLLDAVCAGTFGNIDRAKGCIRCGAQWLRFDVVERAWQVTGADTPVDERSTCVFIGQGLCRPWLREAFPSHDASSYRTGDAFRRGHTTLSSARTSQLATSRVAARTQLS